jgi:membrane protease YdiL (CAAX protease family)
MSNTSASITYLTSLLIDQRALSGELQAAAVLIQAGRYREAHRLLLGLARDDPENAQLWLLLAWTSPSHIAALEHYRSCLLLDPTNDLARAGVSATLAAIRNNGHHSKSAVSLPQPVVVPKVMPGISSKSHPGAVYQQVSPVPVAHAYVPARLASSGFSIFTQRFDHLSDVHFTWLMLAYLLFLATAELVTTFSSPQFGLGLHGLLLIGLFIQASMSRVRAHRRFLFSIALAPLIRLLSLSMPLAEFPSYYWYAIIGVPLILAAYMVFRLTGYKPADVGLSARKLPFQFIIGVFGLPLGWVEYQILKPAPLVQSFSLQDILIPALILLVFTGFIEEFIFRGLMQRAAENIMGRYGPYWISLLFAVLHIGYRSIADFAFVLAVGLLFAYIVKRTSSIWGVTLAHGLTNIALYTLIPMLLH